jgi:hypothetical protein
MNFIIGRLRDIQPNGLSPSLELFFRRIDDAYLPEHHGDSITLKIQGKSWTGTIGVKGRNDPYIHTHLTDGHNRRSCTDVFLVMGLAEKAELRFLAHQRGLLELVDILSSGSWRPGGHPDQRATRQVAPRDLSRSIAAEDSATPQVVSYAAFPFGDGQAIMLLAETYWSKIRPGEQAEERSLEAEMQQHRKNGWIDKDTFVRLARWKSVRKTSDYEANSQEEVRAATREAFVADSDAVAIAALCKLRGVALRTATALLHWMVPDRYPILDVRVLAALEEDPRASFEDVAFYSRIADRVRLLAQQVGVDLRTIDRALWTWDKVRSS